MDFFALLAALTLLLAHLDSHHQRHRPATNLLAHQRLGDRAMLHQALEQMDVMTSVCKDPISEQSAKLIRRLLDVEADAAEGNEYTARSVRENEGNTLEDGEKEGGELRLHIPYLGVIKIARQDPISWDHSLLGNATSRQPPRTHQVDLLQRAPSNISPSDTYMTLSHAVSATEQTQPLDRLHYRIDRFATSPNDLSVPERFSTRAQESTGPPTGYDGQSIYMLQECEPSDQDDITYQPHIGLPCITAGADGWAFQGVDMAFFDSLMRGTSYHDAVGLDP